MAGLPEQRVLICNDVESGIKPDVAEGIALGAESLGYEAVLAGSLAAAYEHVSGSYSAIFVASNNLITARRRNIAPHKAFPKPELPDVNRFMTGIALWNASLDERHGTPWAQKALKQHGISLKQYHILAFLFTEASDKVADLPDDNIYRLPTLSGHLEASFSALRTKQMLADIPSDPHLYLVPDADSSNIPTSEQESDHIAA